MGCVRYEQIGWLVGTCGWVRRYHVVFVRVSIRRPVDCFRQTPGMYDAHRTAPTPRRKSVPVGAPEVKQTQDEHPSSRYPSTVQ